MAKFNPEKYVPLPPEFFATQPKPEQEVPTPVSPAAGGYEADFARFLKQGRIGGSDDEDN